jgi:hypothetical protein
VMFIGLAIRHAPRGPIRKYCRRPSVGRSHSGVQTRHSGAGRSLHRARPDRGLRREGLYSPHLTNTGFE